jgi:hypothetical protein
MTLFYLLAVNRAKVPRDLQLADGLISRQSVGFGCNCDEIQ